MYWKDFGNHKLINNIASDLVSKLKVSNTKTPQSQVCHNHSTGSLVKEWIVIYLEAKKQAESILHHGLAQLGEKHSELKSSRLGNNG